MLRSARANVNVHGIVNTINVNTSNVNTTSNVTANPMQLPAKPLANKVGPCAFASSSQTPSLRRWGLNRRSWRVGKGLGQKIQQHLDPRRRLVAHRVDRVDVRIRG